MNIENALQVSNNMLSAFRSDYKLEFWMRGKNVDEEDGRDIDEIQEGN